MKAILYTKDGEHVATGEIESADGVPDVVTIGGRLFVVDYGFAIDPAAESSKEVEYREVVPVVLPPTGRQG